MRNFGSINEFTNIYMLFNNSKIIEELNKLYKVDFNKKRLGKSKIKKFLNY